MYFIFIFITNTKHNFKFTNMGDKFSSPQKPVESIIKGKSFYEG